MPLVLETKSYDKDDDVATGDEKSFKPAIKNAKTGIVESFDQRRGESRATHHANRECCARTSVDDDKRRRRGERDGMLVLQEVGGARGCATTQSGDEMPDLTAIAVRSNGCRLTGGRRLRRCADAKWCP